MQSFCCEDLFLLNSVQLSFWNSSIHNSFIPIIHEFEWFKNASIDTFVSPAVDILELVTDGVDLFNTAYLLFFFEHFTHSTLKHWELACDSQTNKNESQIRTIFSNRHTLRKVTFFFSFLFRYPNILTELGLALTLPLEPKLSTEIGNVTNSIMNNDKINLRDVRFKLDTQPLVTNCRCYTCSHHTRAYIHHLLNTHEMLANILLSMYIFIFIVFSCTFMSFVDITNSKRERERDCYNDIIDWTNDSFLDLFVSIHIINRHNCYHYLEFFRVLRTHLKNNTFLQFKNEILQLYNHTYNVEYNERYKV
jgi:hypothetical protein